MKIIKEVTKISARTQRERERERDEFGVGFSPEGFVFCIENNTPLLI